MALPALVVLLSDLPWVFGFALTATPRAWNDLQTFTAPFHCFLSGPSSKHSFPTTYANLLTVLYEP